MGREAGCGHALPRVAVTLRQRSAACEGPADLSLPKLRDPPNTTAYTHGPAEPRRFYCNTKQTSPRSNNGGEEAAPPGLYCSSRWHPKTPNVPSSALCHWPAMTGCPSSPMLSLPS